MAGSFERDIDSAHGAAPQSDSWVHRVLAEQQALPDQSNSNASDSNTSLRMQNRPEKPPGHLYKDFDANQWMAELDLNHDNHITSGELRKWESDTFDRYGSMKWTDFQRQSALLLNLDLIQDLCDDDKGPEIGISVNDLRRLGALESQVPSNAVEKWLARLYEDKKD